MELNVFSTEQWMTDHEGSAAYNLTDTCVRSLSLKELIALDHEHVLDDVKLDYGVITGDTRLKEYIAKLYANTSIDQITMTSGCNQANELVMETLLEPGDGVVTFTPGYQSFWDYPASLGCKVRRVKLYEEKNWLPDEKELEQAFDKDVKLVILNAPNNPTGTVFPPKLQKKLIALCRKAHAWLLVDEVYRMPGMPTITDDYEYAVSTSSLSKNFGLAGLRLGWIKGPQELIEKINYRRDYSIISTGPLIDALGLIVFQNEEVLLKRSDQIISEARKAVCQWLEEEKRCSMIMPKAGTVSFLRYDADIPSAQLCEQLQKEYGVFFVPGSCFDEEYHLRLCFTNTYERMAEGLKRFSCYLDEQIG